MPPLGRPIISTNQCPTEPISGLIDHSLRPYVPLLKSYINKDSTDMIKKIANVPPIPQGALLVSLDVSSIYTNILMTDALKITSNVLRTHRDPNALPKNIELCLISLVLTCNNLEFNGEHFLQIQDVAMSTKCAPTIANFTIGDFEDRHFYTYHFQPLILYWFIDDIFMIWTHGQEALHAFIQQRPWLWETFWSHPRALQAYRLPRINPLWFSHKDTGWNPSRITATSKQHCFSTRHTLVSYSTIQPLQPPPVMGIIKDASPILHTDPKLVSVVKKCVIVGHSRPNNLRDYLVKSRLQYPPPPPQGYSTSNPQYQSRQNLQQRKLLILSKTLP